VRFIVDESTGKAVAQFLVDLGHDVLYVGDVMPQATDGEILKHSLGEKRILFTNDKDFGELIYRGGFEYYGVVLLRLQDDQPSHRAQIVSFVLENHADRLVGNFSVASEKSFRVRSKP